MSSSPGNHDVNPYSYDGAAAPARSGILPDDTVYWIPTEGATLHNGKRIPARMEFPFLPPPELGEVYTASSEMRGALLASLWHGLHTMVGRTISSMLFGILVGFQSIKPAQKMFRPEFVPTVVIVVSILAAIVIEVSRRLTEKKFKSSKSASSKILTLPQCSYVCEFGFVQWFRSGEGYRSEIETFDRFSHSLYQGQELDRATAEAIEAVLVSPRDEHRVCLLNSNLLPVFDDFEFSIQIAWTKLLLRGIRAKLANGEYYDFPVRANLVFRFWADRLEMIVDRRTIRVTKSDVVLFRFTFDQKIKFFIREHLSPENRGEFVMSLLEIANVATFCTLIETIFGIKMEGKKVDFLPKWHHGGW